MLKILRKIKNIKNVIALKMSNINYIDELEDDIYLKYVNGLFKFLFKTMELGADDGEIFKFKFLFVIP